MKKRVEFMGIEKKTPDRNAPGGRPTMRMLTAVIPVILLLAGLLLLAGCGGSGSDGSSDAPKDVSPYAGRTPADLSGYRAMADAGEDDGPDSDSDHADSSDSDGDGYVDDGPDGNGSKRVPVRLVETNVAEATSYMDNKEAFALFLSYADCDYCQVIMPYVNEAANNANQTVGYIDTRKDPSWMSNTDIDDYDKFVEYFGDFLEKDDEGRAHVYTPVIYFIRNGKIVACHDGVVEGLTDPSRKLTENQQEELRMTLADEFDQMLGR